MTLRFYIAWRFLTTVAAAFMAVLAFVIIVELVDLMQANADGRATFVDLLGMAALQAPSVTITAAPFTVLLASMTCFAMLARRSELVVTRAAGVSVWEIIAPTVAVAALLGIVTFAVYNPLASSMAGRFETLEARYLERTSSRLSVSPQGLWLRQGSDRGQTVIRARRAGGTIERLWDVLFFEFDGSDRLYRRIAARTAVLEERAWRLNAVRRWDFAPLDHDDSEAALVETFAVAADEMRIETDLTKQHIRDSLAAPRTIGFWGLPGFIEVLEASGFSSARHRMHWHGLLSAPLAFVAMVLIGAAFSTRHARFGGRGLMALGCVISGFGYFFLSDIANALGAAGTIPVLLAAWAPPISAILFALSLLLHLGEG